MPDADEDDLLEPTVELAFVAPASSSSSSSSSDVTRSKVGGQPVWLDCAALPRPEELACGVCGEPRALLVQVYTPDEVNAESWHRVVYVFACLRRACHAEPDKCFAVVTCQAGKDGAFYDANGRRRPSISGNVRPRELCAVCGGPGDSACGKCRTVRYCSRVHQAAHWRHGHKEACGQAPATATATAAAPVGTLPAVLRTACLFPEHALTTEDEDIADDVLQEIRDLGDDGDDVESDGEGDRPREGADPAIEGAEGAGSAGPTDAKDDPVSSASASADASDSTAVEPTPAKVAVDRESPAAPAAPDAAAASASPDAAAVPAAPDAAATPAPPSGQRYTPQAPDACFLAFQRRLAEYPAQVLRYARIDTTDPTPLWVSSLGRPTAADVTPCSWCGGPRRFEFQIMSPLLAYLGVDDLHVDSIDWGTLLVYTCPANCSRPSTATSAYRRDLLWRQQFSATGAGADALQRLEDA